MLIRILGTVGIILALSGCIRCPKCPDCKLAPPAPRSEPLFGESYSPDGCNICTATGSSGFYTCTSIACTSDDLSVYATAP